MATDTTIKTVDPSEARIWAALGPETPIQQVAYDEANASSHGPSSRESERDDGATNARLRPLDSVEQTEVIKRKYKWLIVFVAILAVASVTLGSFLGLNAKGSPVAAPTSRPTSRLMDDLRSELPAYSLKIADANASSPQGKALAWLQNDSDYALFRLKQRYALGVLYYSTNGQYWNNSREWMSDTDECGWYSGSDDRTCDESSHLLNMVLGENNLDGSIPTELELLTGLTTLDLSGATLSGSIHSELYVE
jgi:hypothetical protein